MSVTPPTTRVARTHRIAFMKSPVGLRFGEALDSLGLRLERFQDREQLRDIQNSETSRAQVVELQLAAALTERDVLADQHADAATVHGGDFSKVQQHLAPPGFREAADRVTK